jgi:hypothetical protein
MDIWIAIPNSSRSSGHNRATLGDPPTRPTPQRLAEPHLVGPFRCDSPSLSQPSRCDEPALYDTRRTKPTQCDGPCRADKCLSDPMRLSQPVRISSSLPDKTDPVTPSLPVPLRRAGPSPDVPSRTTATVRAVPIIAATTHTTPSRLPFTNRSNPRLSAATSLAQTRQLCYFPRRIATCLPNATTQPSAYQSQPPRQAPTAPHKTPRYNPYQTSATGLTRSIRAQPVHRDNPNQFGYNHSDAPVQPSPPYSDHIDSARPDPK